MTSDNIQILIADDHPLFRFGLCALLEAESGTAVIGEATTGVEAPPFPELTPRELEVLQLIAQGLTLNQGAQLRPRNFPPNNETTNLINLANME